MIPEKALVLYKNRPAVVTAVEDSKITIVPAGAPPGEKSQIKVREKDVELLHPGPCASGDLEDRGGDVRSAWELLEGSAEIISLKELSELVFETYTPQSALAAWKFLDENVYFTGDIFHIKAKSRAELEAEEKKRREKQQEADERGAFLERIREALSKKTRLDEKDFRQMQDVEALALGHTDKSRTLRESGWSETPVDAHNFLLTTGVWNVWKNPHPGRFGLSLASAKIPVLPPPEEDRLDLSNMSAFAIDNAWSDDPDDAVSLEGPDSEGRLTLWVHVADPAASVTPGCPADIEARDRGATLYLPEGSVRMLAEESLRHFALGYRNNAADSAAAAGNPENSGDKSPALSFKIILNSDLSIADTQIFPSLIHTTRLTYTEADDLLKTGETETGETLVRLYAMAERNMERRLNTGAILIELPEAHIHVRNNSVTITPVPQHKSADLVRECMVLAGEAAARWAVRNRVPFPYISQEAGDIPNETFPGFAGAWQLRKSMRPRVLSNRPGVHWGLGLDLYTQVTSPLRRYTDLLAHQQIRSFLKGDQALSDDEILVRITTADAGAAAAAKAERASRLHWTAVYLADKIGSSWDAVCLSDAGSRAAIIIPDLGLETQIPHLRCRPNDKISVTCAGVKIPDGMLMFNVN